VILILLKLFEVASSKEEGILNTFLKKTFLKNFIPDIEGDHILVSFLSLCIVEPLEWAPSPRLIPNNGMYV